MADWTKIRSRGKVVDRRAARGAGAAGGLGTVGFLVVMGLTLLGGGNVDLNQVFTQLEQTQVQPSGSAPSEFDGEDSYEVFAASVLGSANDMWEDAFEQTGRDYREPSLVLFRRSTNSACGGASSAIGPHYCPADETIYIDETFFDELQRRFGARGGDVAEAYVIAHEVGHHAQNLLGVVDKVQRNRYADNANELSVAMELQADCFAGLWAASLKDAEVFEPGELEEAIDAAEAVGDDRIQERTTGSINPENWTHGSSEQRKTAFESGANSGQLAACSNPNL